MKVLVGCERFGRVRDAFIAAGHDAVSCDLAPSEAPGPHIIGDVLAAVTLAQWDLAIFFPDCTYLTASGLHWNNRRLGRAEKTEQAAMFFLALTCTGIPRWAIENPIGCMSQRYRKPDQIIQPNWFGEDASKSTCLWLHGLPLLEPTNHIAPRMVDGRPRWANQTDGGQNRLGPSPERALLRAVTYPGIAQAMAQQWGKDE